MWIESKARLISLLDPKSGRVVSNMFDFFVVIVSSLVVQRRGMDREILINAYSRQEHVGLLLIYLPALCKRRPIGT